MPEDSHDSSVSALVTAHAVLHTVDHILRVSTSLEDARQQVERLLDLVQDKAREQQIPAAMLREAGRDMLMELL